MSIFQASLRPRPRGLEEDQPKFQLSNPALQSYTRFTWTPIQETVAAPTMARLLCMATARTLTSMLGLHMPRLVDGLVANHLPRFFLIAKLDMQCPA